MPDPFYVLAAAPSESVRLKGFFRDGEASPGWLLTRPQLFRGSGFDVSTGDIARLVDGERWEVRNGTRKLLKLYSDGTLLFRMRADGDFLGWGQSGDGFAALPALNPVAVVESHTSFVHLYRRVVEMLTTAPPTVHFSLTFSDAFIDNRPLSLTKYYEKGVARTVNPDLFPIHDRAASLQFDAPTELLVSDPDAVAFSVLSRFYAMFDAEPTLIPFTEMDNSGGRVNVSMIQRL